MKKVLTMFLAAVMMLTFAGCSSETPKTAVDSFLKNAKSNPVELFPETVFSVNGLSDEANSKLKEFVTSFDYEITNETVDGDNAEVTVSYKNADPYDVLFDVIDDCFKKANELATGTSKEDTYKEFSTIVVDRITAALTAEKAHTGEAKLKVTKQDKRWVIDRGSLEELADGIMDGINDVSVIFENAASAVRQNYEYTDGRIVLKVTEKMEEIEAEGFDYSVGCNSSMVLTSVVTREELAELGASDITYAEFVSALRSDHEGCETGNIDGIEYLAYTWSASEDDASFYYFIPAYEDASGLWTVNFICYAEDAEKYKPIFMEWAKNVSFK